MKKIMLILVIYLTFVNYLYGKGKYNVQIGTAISSLRNEKTKWEPGLTVAAHKEWNIYNHFYIGSGFQYTNVTGLLKNKTILPSGTIDIYKKVIHQDILVSYGFVDIPLLLRYNIPFVSKINLFFVFGYGFTLAFQDKTEYQYLYTEPITPCIKRPAGEKCYEYDYVINEDGYSALVENSGYHVRFSLGIGYSRFAIESGVKLYLHEINVAKDAYYHEKLQSIYILLCVYF